MNIEDQSPAFSAADSSTASLNTTGALEAGVVEIIPPSEIAAFNIGDAFCDTRPEVLERVRESIRRECKKDHRKRSLPTQVHVRILNVAPGGIHAILDKGLSARPELILFKTALALIRSGEWLRAEADPLPANRMCDHNFSARAKDRRNQHFELIRPLIELGPDMFDATVRWQTVVKICQGRSVSPTVVYRLLRRYWQGGMTRNALIGGWFRRRFRRGLGAGILTMVEARNGARPVAIGRRRKDETGNDAEGSESTSFHVTAVDVQKIIAGARQFLHTPTGGSVHTAWLLTVAQYYFTDLAGLPVHEMKKRALETGPQKYPSERQFRYWINADKAIMARLKARYGNRKFDLEYRALKAKTEDKTTGPGSDFQVDPTRTDVIGVHEITRRPIGRLTVYLVVDCFTHLIVGYFIIVGNAGYDAAALALLATARDKVELCREFGIEISPAEWPCACLPERLRADSELASLKAHALVEEKLMELTITPPYRADLKGLVEAMLGSLTRSTIIHLPGYSTGVRKRATTNPDATAALDYRELNQIVIHWILQRNRRVMPDYNRTEPMIRDGVLATPINLWNWGVAQCSGLRRKWDLELLKLLCLPKGDGIITRHGLEFDNLVYEPADHSLPEFAVWQVEADAPKSWKETVSYNPVSVDEVWLHHEGRLVRMRLAEISRVRRGWSWAGHKAETQEVSDAASAEQTKTIPLDVIDEAAKAKIVADAVAKTEAARGTVAARRREKVNKNSERLDQQNLISGRNRTKSPADAQAAPSTMADADEKLMAERLAHAIKA